MTSLLQGPMFRLNIVVMSSLAFLAFGFNSPSGPIEALQIPVAALQIYFILAVAMQVGLRGLLAPLSKLQQSLILALIIYVIIVSAISPTPSALILAPTWIIHILFLVALISFFKEAGMDNAEVIWSALGLTALIHVGAFLIAQIIWPAAIYANDLPAFGNIRHLGYLLAPAAAVMAMLFVTRFEKALFPLFCFSAAAFYIFYTGSRGGAIALVAGLMATSVFWAWHGQRAYVSRMLILSLVTGVLIIISELVPSLPWPTVFSRLLNTLEGTEALNWRSGVWGFASQAIKQNWLWGYGPALLSDLPHYPLDTAYYQPHNIGLQLLLHWGVMGGGIILGMALSFSKNVLAALHRLPALARSPFAALTTLCIHAFVDGGLFYPFSVVVAIIAFAALEVIGRQQSCQSESNEDDLLVST